MNETRNPANAVIEAIADEKQIADQRRDLKKMGVQISRAISQRVIDHDRLIRVIELRKAESDAPKTQAQGNGEDQ